ncbi:MAG: PA-phosphatase, partial [Comamonadaceae bacterium]
MQSDLSVPATRETATPAWRAEIAYRMRHLFLLKLVGTSVFIGIFFVAYFHLL